jgi:dolichol kinase
MNNIKDPKQVKDNYKFFSLLALFSIVLFFLLLYFKNYEYSIILLLFTIFFVLKYETEAIKHKIDFIFLEIDLDLKYLENKIKK